MKRSLMIGAVTLAATVLTFGGQAQDRPLMQMLAPGAETSDKPTVSDPYDLLNAFHCRVIVDKGGKSQAIDVKVLSDPGLDTISVAERRAGSLDLTIIVNPYWMNKFAPQTRLFWREHECAHHTLSHTLVTTRVDDRQMAQDEDDADCTAIQTMVKGLAGQPPMIDREGLARIEKDLRRWLLADGYYKSGDARAAHVAACARAVGG